MDFDVRGGQNVLKNIQAQLNGTYSLGKPIKATILANEYNGFSRFFHAELAKQPAKFTQTDVEVSLLVPESAPIKDWDKRRLEENGVAIVKAKKRPCFPVPIDWLSYPPEKLKSGIVIGIGARLGKIAQHWKERYQYKKIYIDQGNERPLGSCYKVVETYEDLEDYRKKLSIAANFSVPIGPKTTDDLSASLRSERKQVFNLAPGIFSHFSNSNHVANDGRNFRVLLLGGDNPDNFFKDGLKTAADAVAELKNNSYHLIYVGTGKATEQQFKDLFHECGVSKSQLRIRNLPKTEDEWKKLFCEVDLAIMPSDDKEFALEAPLALSAGCPVLVHGESGFGEALRDVTFGTSAIVDSDDAREWASRIKTMSEKDKKIRLEEAAMLRSNYDEKYSWEKQCGVSKSQLRIRNLPKTEDQWKKLFCVVDLAIMPSDDKEFGLEALLSLSAGRPVLVYGESGFGEALRDVTFGTSAIVDSDDARACATNDGRNFRVLLLGGDNPDNFFKDGLKTAADAVAELKNNSYHLIYVGTGKATEQQFKDLFHECGVSKSQLRIRNLPKTEDEWKKLFCEVDLAIMPSDDKEFALEAPLALSAGCPVLVHGESGFGEALRDVTFGTSAIVDSDDAREWASRIKTIREKDKKTRLEEAAMLRANYDEKYSWEKQLTHLVAMM